MLLPVLQTKQIVLLVIKSWEVRGAIVFFVFFLSDLKSLHICHDIGYYINYIIAVP